MPSVTFSAVHLSVWRGSWSFFNPVSVLRVFYQIEVFFINRGFLLSRFFFSFLNSVPPGLPLSSFCYPFRCRFESQTQSGDRRGDSRRPARRFAAAAPLRRRRRVHPCRILSPKNLSRRNYQQRSKVSSAGDFAAAGNFFVAPATFSAADPCSFCFESSVSHPLPFFVPILCRGARVSDGFRWRTRI